MAALVALTPGALSGAAAQAAPGAIAFMSTRGGDADIYSIGPDGKGLKLLTTKSSTPDDDPAWSPDGKKIAFASKRNGNYEVYVMDVDGSKKPKVRRLTRNTASDKDPVWSPDGKQIAFTSDRRKRDNIYVIPSTGCPRRARNCPTLLTKNRVDDRQPSWSPDGKQIAFSSKRRGDRDFEVYVMNANGSGQKRLTRSRGHDFSPAWSPNGKQIAYVSKRRGDRDLQIYVMNANGSGQTRLTRLRGNEGHPTWSPDGKQIAFTGKLKTNLEIFVMNANGSGVRRITKSRARDMSASWGSPAGAPAAAARPAPTPRPRPTARPTATPTLVPPTPTATATPPADTPTPTATATATPAATATALPTATATATTEPTVVPGQAFTPDEIVSVLGFSVQMGDLGDADTAWESLASDSLTIEVADASVGSDQFRTLTPGHKVVGEVVLTGPVLGGGRIDGAELLENGAGKFSIDLEGLGDFSTNIRSVDIEPLTIDIRELSTGADWDFRVFGPGDAHLGTISLAALRGSQTGQAYQWWVDSSNGQDILKTLSVIARDRDGDESRRWDFFDCFSVSYSPFGQLSPSSNVAVETLTLKCADRVELSAPGTSNQSRAAMSEWLNSTILGGPGPIKRDLTITEVHLDGSDGVTYTYKDAFPTRYVFPQFSATGTGNLKEEITFKPERLEID